MAKKKDNNTPRTANWLLSKFVDRALLEEFLGDLQEVHQERISSKRKSIAILQYWIDVLHLLFGFISFKAFTPHNPAIMYKLNWILSWRNIKKNRIFSFINIGGLALGMIVALLIGLWVQDELQYNTFHEHYDHTYKVIAHRDFGDNIYTDHNMTFPYARVISEEIPEVEHAVWVSHLRSSLLSQEDKALKKRGYTVGGPYFEVFSWKFLEGNAEQALLEPKAIVLTESTAKAFFGNTSPLNQSITINNDEEVTISGVIQDPPSNSSIDFDFILPYNYNKPEIKRLLDHWNNYSWGVYVKTLPNTDIDQLDKDLTAIMVERTESEQSTYFAHPMAKWHLHNEFRGGINTGGRIRYIRLFGVIAIIILIIACINFMNLSTARSQKRSMEVAVRKTLGSSRGALIQQFLTESTLIACLAFLGAILAVVFLLPHFNQLVNRSIELNWSNPL
nr:ABC transporter permease [Saprospiraceae bacterium]